MIREAVTVGPVTTESFYVAPFAYPGNAMVMLLKVTNTSGSAVPVTAFALHNFKLGSAPNPDSPGDNGEQIAFDTASGTATETGPGGGTMVYAPIGGVDVASCQANAYDTVNGGGSLTQTPTCSGSDQKMAFSKDLGSLAPGASAWWGVAVLFDSASPATARAAWSTFAGTQTADQLYSSILAEIEAWRKPPVPGLSDTELANWRQAEMVLRMGQIVEPYDAARHNHGMMLASLPPGGWHTGWTRDGTYALTALARSGHFDQARDGLDFFLDADAGRYGSYLSNVPYRISTVRYYGNGQEEVDYSGQPTPNIEIDGWGLYLWAARSYVDASGDLAWLSKPTRKGDTVYDAIKTGVAESLAAQLEQNGMAIADASIWEVHWGNRQHFLYTTATAARGFCDMATLARRAGKTDDIARYKALADNARMALVTNFVDSQSVLAGSLEELGKGSNYHDGSTIEAINLSVVPSGDPIANATLGAMSHLATPAGGYKRLEGSSDQYDTDEWILIDLRASAAFRRAGQSAKADQLLDWVTGQGGANYNLLPELYNTVSSSGQIGAYSGSIPMVGYGAGAYLMTLLDRAELYEHTDCGDKDITDYPDAGPVITNRDGMGGNTAVDGARTGFACACNGGPGSASTGVLLLVVGALVMRRRKA